MGRTAAWHQATPQRLEPVRPGRDYGAGVPRRCRSQNRTVTWCWTGPTLAISRLGTVRLTRATTVLISLPTVPKPPTSPESLWPGNRVIVLGAEVRILDQGLTDTALYVTLRA